MVDPRDQGRTGWWTGSRAEVPSWSPGAPGVLVGSCFYVGMHGFLGRRFITLVSFPKASMPPTMARTFAERQVKPASVVRTREAVPLEPGHYQGAVFCEARHFLSLEGQVGPRSQLSTQACSLLPNERGGPWSGGQAARMRPSGSHSQGTEPASNSGLHQHPLLALQGTSQGRS